MTQTFTFDIGTEAASPTGLTPANIRDEVKTMLGQSAVDVELLDGDIDKAIKDAVRLFNRWIGCRSRGVIPSASGGVVTAAVATAATSQHTGSLTPVVNPGSVVFVLAISANSPATIRDTGNGVFVGMDSAGGSVDLTGSTISYTTGAYSLTLGGGLSFLQADGAVTYTLSSASGRFLLDHPGVAGILHVEFLTRDRNTQQFDVFDPMAVRMSTMAFPGVPTFGEYMLAQMYREAAWKVIGVDPDWHVERLRGGNGLYLYVSVPSSVQFVGYEYLWHVTPDTHPMTGMHYIPAEHHDIINDFVVARAKQMLGRILRKHGGVSTAEGGVDQTDGEALVSEGIEAERELQAAFKRRTYPTPPLVG